MTKSMRNLAALAALTIATAAQAAGATYQVTGPVVDVSDTTIVVTQEKGKNKGEKFEMARTADTKVTGDLKKGAKVTVEYTLTAKSVEVKADKAAKKK
ncbi:MAG TPA: hypothetical protein VMT17_17875 [Anaeromyxobacteraceae bacterium]|nr:hypothetical protein [Anaeromyxobacteraceae bacterium]